MFTALKRWLGVIQLQSTESLMGVIQLQSTESLMGDFHKLIAKLDFHAKDHLEMAWRHAEEIVKLEQEKVASEIEAAKASKIITKLKDLVGGY